jgi:hypothetical protein
MTEERKDRETGRHGDRETEGTEHVKLKKEILNGGL